MAFMAVLESDLRVLSAEARRRYPAIEDGAEHVILQLRSLSSPSEIAHNEDVLRIFLTACEVKSVKLRVIGLSCLQKLISHDAVAPSALKEILSTLKEVSADLSIVDLDVPFNLAFSFAATMNTYANLGVLAITLVFVSLEINLSVCIFW